jgi:hypothetical protein
MTVADQGVHGLILRLHSVGGAFTSRDYSYVGFEALKQWLRVLERARQHEDC